MNDHCILIIAKLHMVKRNAAFNALESGFLLVLLLKLRLFEEGKDPLARGCRALEIVHRLRNLG